MSFRRARGVFLCCLRAGNKRNFRLSDPSRVSTPYLVAAFAGFIYFRFISRNQVLANVAAFLFVAVAVSGLANDLVKVLVGRSRPGPPDFQGLLRLQTLYGSILLRLFPVGPLEHHSLFLLWV